MNVTLYGIPDENYFEWRNTVLKSVSELGLDFQFEECTSLDKILRKGIKDVPCLMIGDTIIDHKNLGSYHHESL